MIYLISLLDFKSIEYGLGNIDKYVMTWGDCFIFDGSDSTSLMGSYEVLEQSNATCFIQKSIVKKQRDYKEKTSFNKWFFGNGSGLDLGYDIPKENWDRIKLSGWNLGYMAPQGFRPQVQTWHPPSTNKIIDLSAFILVIIHQVVTIMVRMVLITKNIGWVVWEVIGDDAGYTFRKDKLLVSRVYSIFVSI